MDILLTNTRVGKVDISIMHPSAFSRIIKPRLKVTGSDKQWLESIKGLAERKSTMFNDNF